MKNSNSSLGNICAFVLTYNEELHIDRVIASLKLVTDEIVVIDSFSTDRTVEFARRSRVTVLQNEWPGSHALQLNWAIRHHNTAATWLMRLDADEYLSSELVRSIISATQSEPEVNGFIIQRGHVFLGKEIRFGGDFPLPLLRLWRSGCGYCEERLMDEHIVLDEGSLVDTLSGYFWDDNLNGLGKWIDKHNKYASAECVEQLLRKDDKLTLKGREINSLQRIASPKRFYENMPAGIRSLLYFLYRYIFRLGFLDGYRGFLWHFLQAFWYRTLVDAKVFEIEHLSDISNKKVEVVIQEIYGHDVERK